MTIITKPISEKKTEKLVIGVEDPESNEKLAKEDVEAQSPAGSGIRMVIIPAGVAHPRTAMTVCLLLTGLAVVGVGIVGGTYLYQQYIRSQLRFKGWCSIPLSDSDINEAEQLKLNDFLQEQFELDLEKNIFEKIEVPDFHDGRSGRFIHDFNSNMTGIVDITGRRCFVMPLNRGEVLPPRDFYDLMHKMWNGYYKIDTEIVRETMHVATPALIKDERKNIGAYIASECKGLPIYKLEKYIGGVVKRSAELGNGGTFIQFAGTRVTEFEILNLDDAKGSQEVVAAP